jgi:putative flippase GtrA
MPTPNLSTGPEQEKPEQAKHEQAKGSVLAAQSHPLNETRTRERSTREVVRYLMVGGFNTVFGYGCFAAFNMALEPLGAHAYLLASLLANLVAISVAFLGYKWFVFRTRGNYLREWLRCMAVYSTTILVTLAGMPIVVTLLRHTRFGKHAPYIAAAVMALVTIALGYLGHKHISFRRSRGRRADDRRIDGRTEDTHGSGTHGTDIRGAEA